MRKQLAEQAYVVDASIAGRWYVNNPPYVDEARQVQADADQGTIEIIAPENLLHELTSIIHQAVFARRLSARLGREQLERFLARRSVSPRGLDRGLSHGVTGYEALGE